MVSLNEVASLASQLNAIMDDSERAIIAIEVYDGKPKITMRPNNFLSEFIEFEIEVLDNDKLTCPFRLSAKIQGATFLCVMSATEIDLLRLSMPEQSSYILNKLKGQLGPNCKNCDSPLTDYQTYPEPNGYGWDFECWVCGYSESGFEA
ncbi:hypothetical protein [Mycobacterium tuberculosis]|uniref:hypothetical protein n=1 Tax=Mycobacterium tuberculosis TaxID=1773 RepID=UPI002874B6A2|nr:hypothetical protein [Mycobacterium tuberculosis]MDS0320886.1 hypothetical protein [Mycobacterium tuberculosis]